MGYVVVDTASKCCVRHPRTGKELYHTESAAKAAMTRFIKKSMQSYQFGNTYSQMEVMSVAQYDTQVPSITVKNLMSGTDVVIRADTPWHLRVDSETYWSN